jgi:uncharacterized membrane protein YvlD (DUF360 family)
VPADERIETVGQALKGVFADPGWLKKSAIGAAVNMIPYVGAFWVIGYGLHYQRALAWGREDRLPEWKDGQAQLKTGLYIFVVGMVYSLPLSVVLTALLVVAIAGGTLVVAASEQVGWVIAAAIIAMIVYMLVTVLYSIVLWPVYTHVQLYDSIPAGFEFRRVFEMVRENSSAFWTAARRSVVLNLASMAAGLLVVGVTVGIAIALSFGIVSEEIAPVASLMAMPIQLLLTGIIGLITVPISLAMSRLWAGYARIAYGLGAPAAEVPAEAAF